MRIALTTLLILAVITLVATAPIIAPQTETSGTPALSTLPTVEETLFSEDFENGTPDWRTSDGTIPGDWAESWHSTTTGAYQGRSWWMGDPEIGGYTNHRYLSLDTPDLTVYPGQSLTFRMNYNFEAPSNNIPSGYDCWEGFNVRISTDGGNTWVPIQGSPAYNSASSYAFGMVFGEGTGIPCWQGNSYGWITATFNLSGYTDQSVRFRFAFASDDGSATDDGEGHQGWFGVRLDDIYLGETLISNADVALLDAMMTPSFGQAESGDFWTLSQGTAWSGTFAMHCPVESRLFDNLVSPNISLPADQPAWVSYRVFCDLSDADGDGDGTLDDYYAVYAKGMGETAWTRLHVNYTYATPQWELVDPTFAESHFAWHDGDCDLSVWAGQTVTLRFSLITDGNNDGGTGTGLYIDDVNVVSEKTLPAPLNFRANLVGEDIRLDWEPPVQGDWLHWDSGTPEHYAGTDEVDEFEVAARFTPADLQAHYGRQITRIRIVPGVENAQFTIRVWSGVNATNLLREQVLVNPVAGQWNTITLNNPLNVPTGSELWIGYHVHATDGYPAGADAGPMVANRGAYVRFAGEDWQVLTAENPTMDWNWCIQAWTEESTRDGQSPLIDRGLSGYRVYRATMQNGDYELLASLYEPGQTSWTDESPYYNTYNYYKMSAVFDGDEESETTEWSRAFVISPNSVNYTIDDGDFEYNYRVNLQDMVVNGFDVATLPQQGFVRLQHVMMFLSTQSTNQADFFVRLYDDDGENGLPGSVLCDFVVPANRIVAGWNIFPIPVTLQPDVGNGKFYAGIVGSTSNISVGVSESVENKGLHWNGIAWVDYDLGHFAIRVLGNVNVGASDTPIEPLRITLTNAPNPFNPETKLCFSLPATARVSLTVFNILGQRVRVLADETMNSGSKTVVWDGKDNDGRPLGSGVYFAKLAVNGKSVSTRKLLMLK